MRAFDRAGKLRRDDRQGEGVHANPRVAAKEAECGEDRCRGQENLLPARDSIRESGKMALAISRIYYAAGQAILTGEPRLRSEDRALLRPHLGETVVTTVTFIPLP